MASDSRVTWINDENLPVKWFDNSNIRKNLVIDGVTYGFAGLNAMFQVFLENYSTKDESIRLLDLVIKTAQLKRAQFFMLRYDGKELKLFANSPESDLQPAIYKVSTDEPISRSHYAIGSGKYSKQYRKHRLSNAAQAPILKIISANAEGMRKKGLLHLNAKAEKEFISLKESVEAHRACDSKGGDLFTGGDIVMSHDASKKDIEKQIALISKSNSEAKANGAVCASPINAAQEVENLHKIGHLSVSSCDIKLSLEDEALIKKLSSRLDEIA